jgi:phosphoglycerate kinase
LRFHSEEEVEMWLRQRISVTGDIYVNDVGTAHRAHASTTIIAQFFQQQNVLIVVS